MEVVGAVVDSAAGSGKEEEERVMAAGSVREEVMAAVREEVEMAAVREEVVVMVEETVREEVREEVVVMAEVKAPEEAMEAAMEEEANSEADLAVGSVEADVEGVDLEVAVPVAARDNIHMHLLSRIASDKIFRSSPGTRAP